MRKVQPESVSARNSLLYTIELNGRIGKEKAEMLAEIKKLRGWQRRLPIMRICVRKSRLDAEARKLTAEFLPKVRAYQIAVRIQMETLQQSGKYDDDAYLRIFCHHMNNMFGRISPSCALSDIAGKKYDNRRVPAYREELKMSGRFLRLLDRLTPDSAWKTDALIRNEYMEDALRESSDPLRRITARIRKEILLKAARKFEP